MNLLTNKHILIGMTGGIAAYKCAELTRRLRDRGAIVKVVMTEGAKAFITPLTMQAVSGQTVMDDLLDPAAEAAMGHIALAKWADVILIAPATANFTATMAQGLAGDLLSTLCLAAAAPIAICPAMNQQMWAASATQRNINTLIADGHTILGPASGEQACGDVGEGRMLEPSDIILALDSFFIEQALAGQKVVITAGPTIEAVDPVRYLSNHSSGKMGYALAHAAQAMGADVTLISGPCALPSPFNVKISNVKTAEEMLCASNLACQQADIFIACAAVADYKVDHIATEKIKKTHANMSLNLSKNPDVLATIATKYPDVFTLGFAAETQNVSHYAKEKLSRKNLNMIAANNVAISGQGFTSNDNALTVFWQEGQQDLPLANKTQLAFDLLAIVANKTQPPKMNTHSK